MAETPSKLDTGIGIMQGFLAISQHMGSREAARLARVEAGRRNVLAQFNALEAERLAGREIAAAQRAGAEERRQAELVASRALAVAAASGAGAADPTVVNLIARTRGEGTYRANLALYEGEIRGRERQMQAMGLRSEGQSALLDGEAASLAIRSRATGELLRTAGSLYARYGRPGPKAEKSGDEALFEG